MIIEDIEVEKLSDYEIEMLQKKWKAENRELISVKVNVETGEIVGEFNVPQNLEVRTFKSIVLNERYKKTKIVSPVFFDFN